MSNDVAIFLDLDNLVIGSKQANLTFDIQLILDHIQKITNGRIVLQRAYGDWRQGKDLVKTLTSVGFIIQATVSLNNFNKNLADMQIVVDSMETLVDSYNYQTYVLITGDRDFTPLVQALRKRGKQVIGLGVRHTTSDNLVSSCDQYVFYEDLVPTPEFDNREVENLLIQARDNLLKDKERERASVLKQEMNALSRGGFDNSSYSESSFRKFLANYPTLISLHQEDTTIYFGYPPQQQQDSGSHLHERYRSALKKQRLRVIPANQRFTVLKDLVTLLQENHDIMWRQFVDILGDKYDASGLAISKNVINDVMLLARQADVIHTLKGKSLSTAPVLLQVSGEKAFSEAILRCDRAYLAEILALPEPFDIYEAAVALYDNPRYAGYLQHLRQQIKSLL